MIFSQSAKSIHHFESEKAFIKNIEQNLSDTKDPKIMQYPYVSFPDGRVINGVGNYDWLIGYIVSNSLKWSFGSVKGRASDAWLSTLVGKSISEQIRILKSSGFNGIYIDRRAYKDHARSMEKKITELTGIVPLVSQLKDRSFFKIKPTGDKPFIFDYMPHFTHGFYGWKEDRYGSYGSIGSHSQMELKNTSNHKIVGSLTFELGATQRTKITVSYNGKIIKSVSLSDRQSKIINLTVILSPGKNILRFSVDDMLHTSGNTNRNEPCCYIKNLRYGLRSLRTL